MTSATTAVSGGEDFDYAGERNPAKLPTAVTRAGLACGADG
ncbi:MULTISPECIES: hypothetical protein [Nocardia]